MSSGLGVYATATFLVEKRKNVKLEENGLWAFVSVREYNELTLSFNSIPCLSVKSELN